MKNSYVPASGENVYTITAKYGAYIGDKWPTPTNDAFTFTLTGQKKELYTWSAYYESRFTQLANDRKGSGQNWHPDINGVYSYMSAELCANRAGTEIINANQVHHLVAYFGDKNKAGIRKNYHILYEAIDGTYDPEDSGITIVPGSDYIDYSRTTWTTNVAQASPTLLNGRSFYEISNYIAISNLDPESQLASDIEGYELIYSCYHTPSSNNHHIYFMYTPKQYTLTFDFGGTTETDPYYYTQTLKEADKYTGQIVVPEGHYFSGWYTNAEGVGAPFDFANETMPDWNLVLYPVLKVLQYTVKIDPNGGELDHRVNPSVSTYFTADYGTPIGEYTSEKTYIKLTEKELDPGDPTYYTGTKYYYINTQRLGIPSEGDWGLPTELRNAVYAAEGDLDTYYNWYADIIDNADLSWWTGISKLTREEFVSSYTDYPYRPVSGEHYTFMGWHQVYGDGTVSSMPYNFNDPVKAPLELRAMWRLDGGYYIQYNPYSFVDDGLGNITAIAGEVEQWTDPEDPTSQLYADQSPTHILRAPTNVTAGWVFRGWRVVRANGTRTFTDGTGTHTYVNWEPFSELHYYQPGDPFTIDSELVTEENSTGKVIHMQAYYEPAETSYRRPDITNLVLDANDIYGGYVNTSDSSLLPAFSGPGSTAINTESEKVTIDGTEYPTQILFGDLQSNLALHLYHYAATKTHYGEQGSNFFTNADGHLLIGFDENSDPESPTTGQGYIPAFAPDAVAAVTRNDNRMLYAMWEPMVYVTFVNTTGADISIDLTGSGADTISIVNEVTGEFDREQKTARITVPAKAGDVNGQVKIVLPGAVPGTDSITAAAVNRHLNYRLNVSGAFDTTDPYGSGSTGVRYGKTAAYTGILETDATGIIVTYTEEEEPSVIFDVNGGTWQEADASVEHSIVDADIYKILQEDVETIGRYRPADPVRMLTGQVDKVFLGWTRNADVAAHTDFSAENEVIWGSTTITPDTGSNVLEKIRSDYLWDFSDPAPYGEKLYAVWSDAVTVTFDLIRTGSNMHNWTGPATTDTKGADVYYRSGGTSQYVTYTLCKGGKVPKPQDPTVDPNWNKPSFIFLEWITTSDKTNTNTNPNAIASDLFDFTAPVVSDASVYTSWMDTQYVPKYTYTVRNQIEGGNAVDEFEYTITAASNMNSSGTYYSSAPAFLPLTTLLKNNESYRVDVTAVRYNASGWAHNSLYLVITDRDGTVVGSGHLIEYQKDAIIIERETSDYQITLTVAQTPKAGYTTTVTSDGSTVDIGVNTYLFGFGQQTKAPTATNTVTTSEQSFTFRSSTGTKEAFVGTSQNYSIGTSYPNVAETIIFTNKGGSYIAPTGYGSELCPFMILLGVGAALALGRALLYRKREYD